MSKPRFLLNTAGMPALSNFLMRLKYKADHLGIKIVKVDAFYPSSKTCSNCGTIDSDLSLSDRRYQCNDCGHIQDRDLNAAINLKQLAAGHSESLNASGDFVSPCQNERRESVNEEDSIGQLLLFSLS